MMRMIEDPTAIFTINELCRLALLKGAQVLMHDGGFTLKQAQHLLFLRWYYQRTHPLDS